MSFLRFDLCLRDLLVVFHHSDDDAGCYGDGDGHEDADHAHNVHT